MAWAQSCSGAMKWAAADAIHAKHEVEDRSKSRHQPDDPDPKRCGAGITFVQQGMG